MVSAYKKSRMQPVQELWKMLKLHTPLNDRNRMIKNISPDDLTKVVQFISSKVKL